jgi:pSer/pThr/pTyr-binding forkhead associated (FHA) protein
VKHHELVDGDVIQLGEHKLLYRNLRNVPRTADDYDAAEELDDEPLDDEEDGLDDADEELEEEELDERLRRG